MARKSKPTLRFLAWPISWLSMSAASSTSKEISVVSRLAIPSGLTGSIVVVPDIAVLSIRSDRPIEHPARWGIAVCLAAIAAASRNGRRFTAEST